MTTTTDLATPTSTTLSSTFATEVARVADLLAGATADNTKRAYRSDLECFAAYCRERGLSPLPAEATTVAAYLAWLIDAKGVKASTARRRLASISTAHAAAGLDSPTSSLLVRTAWRGLAKEIGTASTPKRALSVGDLRAMVATLADDIAGRRDRALILIGFAGALRRSEVVALRVEDVVVEEGRLVVTIRRSKTDQAGRGETIGIDRGHEGSDPVAAYLAWLAASGIVAGPVFRKVERNGNVSDRALSAQSVALVVKAAAERAGLDPAVVSAHSLRSGLATEAARAGAEERDIMRHTRHKSVTVVRGYVQRGSLFERNVTRGLL